MIAVRLYLTDSSALAGREEACFSLLTPKRRKEAASFRMQDARLLCCAAGLLLRRVLGVRSDEDLSIGPLGKPSLAAGGAEFSLSHAGRYSALAVSRQTVGVDVEPVCPPCALPRKVFSQLELDWLAVHPEAEDFCLLWTRLESALKAEGCGLAGEGRKFSLLEPGDPWYWESMAFDGHLFTCAAREPLELRFTALSACALLC